MNFANTSPIRNLEIAISEDNLKSLIETFLRTTKYINDKEDVHEMSVGDLSDNGTRLIRVKFQKEQEVFVT